MQSENSQGFNPIPNSANKISISVTSPLLDTAKNFTTYLVSGNDQLGTIEIRRRYNDFFYLRQSLKKKWPGFYIPPIPQKKIIGNKDQTNTELRRKFFDYFLQRLSEIKHLFYCSVTQQFLRNKTLDMEKYYTTISAPKPADILAEYKTVFPEIKFEDAKSVKVVQIKKIITDFGVYLKRADKELKTMRITVQGIVEARNNFIENLNICNTSTLPEYQKSVYSEYIPAQKRQNLLFVNNHKIQDNMRKLRDISADNSFECCLDLLIYQARQVQAMEELVNDRDAYDSATKKCQEKLLTSQAQIAKLLGGKTTFKSLFSKGNKDEQIKALEKQIPELQKQLEAMSQVLGAMNIIIGTKEIPQFRKFKQLKYYEMMNKVSEKELRYLGSYGEFMKVIMEGLAK